MNGAAPFEAWLTITYPDGDVDRLDLVLARGLDHAGGPQRWHAFVPQRFHGFAVVGTIECETSGDLDPRSLSIDWPLHPCDRHPRSPEHVHLIGPAALQQTLS